MRQSTDKELNEHSVLVSQSNLPLKGRGFYSGGAVTENKGMEDHILVL